VNYSDIKIIIPTCNHYLHLNEGLLWTLDKFWPNHGDVILVGYEHPKFKLGKGVEFVSMGEQTGPEDWSNDLIRFFKDFTDAFFINAIDDSLMTRNADVTQLEYLFNMLKNDEDIGKIFIHGSLNYPKMRVRLEDPKYSLVTINQDSNYRTSIQSAIWRRSYFLQLLKPNLDPWAYEMQHVKNDGVTILSTSSNHPTMYSHLYRKGGHFMKTAWWKSVFEPTELGEEDKAHLSKMLNLK